MRGCHCLCQQVHPDRLICTGMEETALRYNTERLGTFDVPTCRPCADAALGVPAGTVIPGEVLPADYPDQQDPR